MCKCYHCGSEAQYMDAYCESGQGLPHCEDCVTECECCGDVYCSNIPQVDGVNICEACQEKEKELVESVVNSIQIPGYWYAGQAHSDEAVTLEYISANNPKVEVRIQKKSA